MVRWKIDNVVGFWYFVKYVFKSNFYINWLGELKGDK